MPILRLKFKDTAIGDYQLQRGLSLTIGRRKNNDVVIENLAVSGHHAKIDSVGDGFVLIDLQSKNGSFVNEKIVNTHWLKGGDVINIGKHSLCFSYTEDEKITADGSDKIEKTMVMDTSQYRSMMKKSKPDVPKPLIRGVDNRVAGNLDFLSGGIGKIHLTQETTRIGKHPDCDIVVKGLWVGKTAAVISRRSDGIYLSCIGGLAKPRINDKTVKGPVMLNDFDIIDIGSVKLQFHDLNQNKTRILKIKKTDGKPTPKAQ
ncbi:MAG: FHA domain-containing protein [bacterium]|nr:FHA domain-containing protein [bacterium]